MNIRYLHSIFVVVAVAVIVIDNVNYEMIYYIWIYRLEILLKNIKAIGLFSGRLRIRIYL